MPSRAGRRRIEPDSSPVYAYTHGHSRRTVRADLFRTLRGKIVARGMADAELDEIDKAVRTHLADPPR